MSSNIQWVKCPECNYGNACSEVFTDGDTYFHCKRCGYTEENGVVVRKVKGGRIYVKHIYRTK
jgi:uncharacterized Zn finger protein